jgi:hypothetical protein
MLRRRSASGPLREAEVHADLAASATVEVRERGRVDRAQPQPGSETFPFLQGLANNVERERPTGSRPRRRPLCHDGCRPLHVAFKMGARLLLSSITLNSLLAKDLLKEWAPILTQTSREDWNLVRAPVAALRCLGTASHGAWRHDSTDPGTGVNRKAISLQRRVVRRN